MGPPLTPRAWEPRREVLPELGLGAAHRTHPISFFIFYFLNK